MFKSWKAYHSISALSHFTRYDFPRPFSDGSFYEDIIRNIFKDKHRREIVEVELVYEVDNSSGYFEMKIYAPKIHTKIHEIIDVAKFVTWYGERHDIELHKRDDARYYYGDGYTRHAIIFHEVPEDFDFVTIECKMGRYDL